MPIYVFRCDDCGEKFERLQRLSDADPDTCPNCGNHRVRRQVTAPAFRLAGSGWYETDFKSDKEKKRNLAGRDELPKPAPEEAKSKDKSARGDKAAPSSDGPAKASPPAASATPAKGAEG